jgi:16S rRNA A1518/A1519 N6-dimethyltransferase RsmA/KsgA/DIM1 with predicted DNA glycosylase/AP lyase activity
VGRPVVAGADIRPGELVYDLGAGDGALTGPLLAAGARVIAMELHPGRAWSWQLRDGMSLPRRAFRPPPQVDSAVLVVRRR